MIVGCYDMQLYCDNTEAHQGYGENEPAEFTGETAAGCRRQARKAGWRFTQDGRVFCRRCVVPMPPKENNRG
jgi:hypothetical protein